MDANTVAAAAGALAVLATFIAARMETRSSARQGLEALWGSILNLTEEHPEYCDIAITENYLAKLDWTQRLHYDAVCLQAWSIIHEAHIRRFTRTSPRMQLATKWMVAFHLTWLDNNQHLFWNRRFWNAMKIERERESIVTRHRPVIGSDGFNDPEDVSREFFDRVISPFDPSIAETSILDTTIVRSLEQLADASIVVDTSAGPGLIQNRPGIASQLARHRYVAVERSEYGCTVIRTVAPTALIVHGTSKSMPLRDRSADLVIACRGLLNESRRANIKAFEEIARVMHNGSRAILFLPAFEAIGYLGELRSQKRSIFRDRFSSARFHESILRIKQPRQADASYSDDGYTREYFHSLETIRQELPLAGLAILGDPMRFGYPWELMRRFDYGYFPSAPPVWDWVVECELSSNQSRDGSVPRPV